MNILHSPNVPFVNRSNGGYLLENFHFVGGSMNHSTTPSPIGSSDDGAAQVEMQETIDLEGDDSIQPGNSNARTNARTIAGNIATPDARSDRRLNLTITNWRLL